MFDRQPGEISVAISVIPPLPDAPDICALPKAENAFLHVSDEPIVTFWLCPCPPQPQEPPDPAEEGEAGVHPRGARARALPSPYPRWWVPHLCWHCWEMSVALGGLHSFCFSLVLSLARSLVPFGTWTLPAHPPVFPSLTQEAFLD